MSLSCVWLFEAPWTVACQASFSVGGFQVRILDWVALSPASPALAGGFFTTEPPGKPIFYIQFSSVRSLSRVWLFETPWTVAREAYLSITNSWSYGHCWVFQMCWHIECSTFTASSFRIWNSSAGIPSPPLALFIVMLRLTWLRPLGCLVLGKWSYHHGYLGHEDVFCLILCILATSS